MSAYALRIRPRVHHELEAATVAEARGHFVTTFRHLERAHVLAQPSTRLHLHVHLQMLVDAARPARR